MHPCIHAYMHAKQQAFEHDRDLSGDLQKTVRVVHIIMMVQVEIQKRNYDGDAYKSHLRRMTLACRSGLGMLLAEID